MGKILDGIASIFKWLDWKWQLDSMTEKIPSLSPGRGTLKNK